MVQENDESRIDPFQRRRTIVLRWSFGILIVVPFVTVWFTALVSRTFGAGYYINEFNNVIISLLFYAAGSLRTVCVIQVLIWWQWKPHAKPRWQVGLALMAALILGNLVADRAGSVYRETFDQYWETNAVQAVTACAGLALDYLVLAAAGSLVQYRFVDQATRRPGWEDPGGPIVERSTWAIRDFFAATFVAAALLACLRWSRSVYEADPDVVYPVSDASLAVYYLFAAVADLCCVLAAASRRVGGSIAKSIAMLVCGASLLLLGLAFWLYLLPDHDWTFEVSYFLSPVFHVVLVYLLTLWLFRRWEAAGYRLARSESVVSKHVA